MAIGLEQVGCGNSTNSPAKQSREECRALRWHRLHEISARPTASQAPKFSFPDHTQVTSDGGFVGRVRGRSTSVRARIDRQGTRAEILPCKADDTIMAIQDLVFCNATAADPIGLCSTLSVRHRRFAIRLWPVRMRVGWVGHLRSSRGFRFAGSRHSEFLIAQAVPCSMIRDRPRFVWKTGASPVHAHPGIFSHMQGLQGITQTHVLNILPSVRKLHVANGITRLFWADLTD